MKKKKEKVDLCSTMVYIEGMGTIPKGDRIGLRISKDTKKKLKKLADKNKRKLSDYCCIVLEEHANEHDTV